MVSRSASPTVEHPWALEVPSRVSLSEVWLLPEQSVGRCTLQKVKSFRHTHSGRDVHYQMDVIRHNRDLHNLNTMLFCYFSEDILTQFSVLFLPEHVIPVLRAPLKVVQVLSNSMATFNKIHMRPHTVETPAKRVCLNMTNISS